jgi:PTS system galactitol-specific IIC component
MLEVIVGFFDWIVGLGSVVMAPVFIMIIGLIFGIGIGRALKSALLVAIGFVGMNVITGLIGQYLGPVSAQLMETYDLGLSAIDVGWTVASTIAFATDIGLFIIPLCLAVNAIMFVTKQTKTINVDIWNFWHYAFTGAMVYAMTENIWFGYIVAALHMAASLKLADASAPLIESVVGLPGVSIPQASAASTVPLAIFLDKVYDRIPGLNKIKADPETINKKFGIFGEPAVVGFVLGAAMSLLVRLPIKDVLTNGVGVAALLYLLPRMVKILMEGLVPISNAARDFVTRKYSDEEDIYIGMDSAITLGHPTTLAVSVVMIPILFLLAAILPFNIVLPASLTGVAFGICLFTPIHKGDFVRTLISAIIYYTVLFALSSIFAPTFTAVAASVGASVTEGMTYIAYHGWNILGSLYGLLGFAGVLGLVGSVVLTVAVFAFSEISQRQAQKAIDKETKPAGIA